VPLKHVHSWEDLVKWAYSSWSQEEKRKAAKEGFEAAKAIVGESHLVLFILLLSSIAAQKIREFDEYNKDLSRLYEH
jgi:hypothetical protein